MIPPYLKITEIPTRKKKLKKYIFISAWRVKALRDALYCIMHVILNAFEVFFKKKRVIHNESDFIYTHIHTAGM